MRVFKLGHPAGLQSVICLVSGVSMYYVVGVARVGWGSRSAIGSMGLKVLSCRSLQQIYATDARGELLLELLYVVLISGDGDGGKKYIRVWTAFAPQEDVTSPCLLYQHHGPCSPVASYK